MVLNPPAFKISPNAVGKSRRNSTARSTGKVTRVTHLRQLTFGLNAWPWLFHVEPCRIYLRNPRNQDYESFKNVFLADWNLTLRLDYTWGNSLFVPDPDNQERKDLEYEKEVGELPCISNVPQKCTHIPRFDLKHHFIGRLFPIDNKNLGGKQDLVEMIKTIIPTKLRSRERK